MNIREKLVDDIRAYCRESGVSLSAFGVLVVNDGKFFSRLESGKNVTLKNFERAQKWIDDARQAGVELTPEDFSDPVDIAS